MTESEETPHLKALADYAGIEDFYWDVHGGHHLTGDDTRRALLAAMGFDAKDERAARESLERALNAEWSRTLDAAIVMTIRKGVPMGAALGITLDEGQRHGPFTWRVECDDGTEFQGSEDPGDLEIIASRDVAGVRRHRHQFDLPHDVPLGHHTLHVEGRGFSALAPLIITPPACYLPHGLKDDARTWGVACQLYSLSRDGDGGIGDFTALEQLGEAVGRQNGSLVGISPVHALFLGDATRISPYSPSSREFYNPLFIDVTRAPGYDGTDTPDAPTGGRINYAALTRWKLAALERAFNAFEQGDTDELDAFVQGGGKRLYRFALYEALCEHFDANTFHAWPEGFAHPDAPDVKTFADANRARIRFYLYLQWVADRQLRQAAEQARAHGLDIGFYGDLAVGAAADGADLWQDGGVYIAGVRIGAPPDPFSATGQDWGIPPFNPVHLKETGYQPFIRMLRANMRHAGALRIDHAMWLQHVYCIPPGMDGALGAYVQYPMDDLFRILALESHLNRCIVIGEDLGTVPEGFRDRMAHENVLSYRLLAFERHPDGLFKRPDTYPHLSLAMAGSHDLPPLVGYWSEADLDTREAMGLIETDEAAHAQREERAQDRARLLAALADQDLLPRDFPNERELNDDERQALIDAVHRFLARSPAALMLANLEDVLGQCEQVNMPGTIHEHPNWRTRLSLSVEALDRSEALARTAETVKAER